jgi:hypothetical protein
MRTIAIVVALGLVALAVRAPAAAAPRPPKPTRISYHHDAFDQGIARPITRTTDLALGLRKVAGNRREAANLDDLDQVRRPSTWWQPRLGYRSVTAEQMRLGPGPGTGPQRDRKWRVTGVKSQGVSLGIRIKDSAGETFQLKFDPLHWPEMATGADVVVSHLIWAAGYNTPDNAIVGFTRDDLEPAAGATYKDILGHKRPITMAMIDEILAKVPRNADSTYRAVASRYLRGTPLGEWEYRGRRGDDPEDLIPHQHRREIRGFYPIAAWVNHTDGSARNTLDMWVDDGGRSFVRHYLIDFSGCLGSGSVNRQLYSAGDEYFVDYGTMLTSVLTLGLHRFSWESTRDPLLPAVGFLPADGGPAAARTFVVSSGTVLPANGRPRAWGAHRRGFHRRRYPLRGRAGPLLRSARRGVHRTHPDRATDRIVREFLPAGVAADDAR